MDAPTNLLAFGLCLIFLILVPFTVAGLALINAGLGRSRSAAHAMTTALCVMATAMLTYFALGSAVQGAHEPPLWNNGWLATLPSKNFFFHGISWDQPAAAQILLPLLGISLASVVPLGAVSDRLRLGAACASTVLFAGLIDPLFLRAMARFGAFQDAGGSGFIQAVGGLTALAFVWLLGPRQGKYAHGGMPAAIPAHNQVFVLFGCMLSWIGWLGLNSAGAMMRAGAQAEQSILVVVNTTFAAAASALAAAATTRIRFRRPDASLVGNGWMAGLVASSAGCATLKPATATITGIVAGVLVVLSVEWFELHLKVDDPCGSVSVHAVCGIWGLLAAGIFAERAGQFTVQIIGIATLLGFIFPLTYGLNYLLNRFLVYRVSPDGERQGLDLHELGADAYPEFVVHADEFLQR
jgi:Amt family ammonium transporter